MNETTHKIAQNGDSIYKKLKTGQNEYVMLEVRRVVIFRRVVTWGGTREGLGILEMSSFWSGVNMGGITLRKVIKLYT